MIFWNDVEGLTASQRVSMQVLIPCCFYAAFVAAVRAVCVGLGCGVRVIALPRGCRGYRPTGIELRAPMQTGAAGRLKLYGLQSDRTADLRHLPPAVRQLNALTSM
jgi:hypothetical protein